MTYGLSIMMMTDPSLQERAKKIENNNHTQQAESHGKRGETTTHLRPSGVHGGGNKVEAGVLLDYWSDSHPFHFDQKTTRWFFG